MARRRFDIWPAFVDLFIALFVAALGGFVLTAGLSGQIAEEIAKARMVAEAERIGEAIQDRIDEDSDSPTTVSRPGDEVAIDFYFNFPLDSADLSTEDRELVREIGSVIREALEDLPPEDQQLMQVVIEGHTDSTPAPGKSPRDGYLYNWQLSSLRALSVLYEFRAVGLDSETYSVHAVGFADSRPIGPCTGDPEECDRLNRRTTIRLRPDYVKIEQALDGS